MKQVIEDVERAVRYFTSAPTSTRHVTAIEEESCKAPEADQQIQEEILQAAEKVSFICQRLFEKFSILQESVEKKLDAIDHSSVMQQMQVKNANPLSLHIMKKTNDYPQ